MAFVHLRVHSEYSLVDGAIRIQDLVDWAAQNDMGAVGISDHNNLFGLVKLYRAALKKGVKPIIGCDLQVAADAEEEACRITLLVQSEKGYRNLCELFAVQLEKGRLTFSDTAARAEGLICLCGSVDSRVSRLLMEARQSDARQLVQQYMQAFPDRFYLELTRCGRPGEEARSAELIALADALSCPLVATNDVRFVSRADREVHDARVCIHEGLILDEFHRRSQVYTDEQYLKTAAEMEALFHEVPDALQNSVEIARRCTLQLELGRVCLPEYPIPDGSDTETWFKRIAEEGLEKRLAAILDPAAPDYADRKKPYEQRLAHELGVINQMGYASYYLIVMEFIQWARQQDIPVGPGRGSGAGSLVAYALQITNIDPLEYDLVFERFLNPHRLSLPDFDIDFCMEQRDQVIQHVIDRYGKECVSQIVTFGTLAARAVVRDVARVQGRPYSLGDRIARMIPGDPGMTLSRAGKEEPELAEALQKEEEIREIWDMAIKLEGLPRNIGKHAGGVVIAPSRLTDFTPVCADDGGGLLTQFDKDDIEQVGLVKFDFLGLRTLTTIDWALANINRLRPDSQVNMDRLPLNDAGVYRLLQSGRTTSVFQLESTGMKDLMKRLKPDTFDDIGSLVALYRPGPMQMAGDFIARKHDPASVTYSHPLLEPILRSTYGVILYQEQVMQIARDLAGYSMADADVLRVAMGKKKHAEMAGQRSTFLEGAAARGVDRSLAEEVFGLMETFAGYGFNKSHSVAYALVAYQTAWLKAHYPADFMAAVLSVDINSNDKVVIGIEECRQLGVELLQPNINQGEYRFTSDREGRIVYGLGAMRGLGESMAEAIAEARGEQPFTDIYDFCQRVDLQRIKKRAIEMLIAGGAMDCLVSDEALGAEAENPVARRRSLLHASLDEALGQAEQRARDAATGSIDLFGEVEVASSGSARVPDDFQVMSQLECLQEEHRSLGFYLSGHPFSLCEQEVRKRAKVRLGNLADSAQLQDLAGLVMDVRNIRTRQGSSMTFVTLDDGTGRQEIFLQDAILQSSKPKLIKGEVLVMRVKATRLENGRLRISASEVLTVAELRMKSSDPLLLEMNGAQITSSYCARLAEHLCRYSRADGRPVSIRYLGADAEGRLHLGDSWRVEPHDDFLSDLGRSFGIRAVSI